MFLTNIISLTNSEKIEKEIEFVEFRIFDILPNFANSLS